MRKAYVEPRLICDEAEAEIHKNNTQCQRTHAPPGRSCQDICMQLHWLQHRTVIYASKAQITSGHIKRINNTQQILLRSSTSLTANTDVTYVHLCIGACTTCLVISALRSGMRCMSVYSHVCTYACAFVCVCMYVCRLPCTVYAAWGLELVAASPEQDACQEDTWGVSENRGP